MEDLAKKYTYDAVRLSITLNKLEIELVKDSRVVTKETMKGVTDQIFLRTLDWRHEFRVEIDDLREALRRVQTFSDSATFLAMEENPSHLYVQTKNYAYDDRYISQLRISEAVIPSKFAVIYRISYLMWTLDIMELFQDDEVKVEIAGGKIVNGYDLATGMRLLHSHQGLVVEVLVAPIMIDEPEKFVKTISSELDRISSLPSHEPRRRYAEVLENRGADITVSVQWPKELGSYIKIVDVKFGNIYIYLAKDAIWFTAYGYYTGSRRYFEAALQFGGVEASGVEKQYIQLATTDLTIKSLVQMLPKATGTPYLSYYTDSKKLYFTIEDKEGNTHVFELNQSTDIYGYNHKRPPEEWLRPRDARSLYRAEVEAGKLKSILSKYRGGTRVVVDNNGGLWLKGLGTDSGFKDVRLPVKRLYMSEDALQLVGEKTQKYVDVGELREAVARLGRISDNFMIEILEIGAGSTSTGDKLKLSIYAEDPNTRTKAAVYI
jgi:hypothetical protein